MKRDFRKFKPLPKRVFEKLIARGLKDARALDKILRSSFEPGPEIDLRLR